MGGRSRGMRSWLQLGVVAVVAGFLLSLSGLAWAAVPLVKTVPWVASNPLLPHDTWSGKTITLKGTANVQGANYQYTWDFGDGSPVATGTVSNQYSIEAKHAYSGVTGTVFTARLTVRNTDTGESGSKEYYVALRDKTLQVEVNVAIDEGLWYLHKNMTRFSDAQGDKGDWRTLSGYYAINAANVNAFEVNGHLEQGDPANPYVETVQRGMRRLFDYLTSTAISAQTYPDIGTVNPDSNSNGQGIQVNQGQYVYQGGMFMDAIITSGTPDKLTTSGNSSILGRKYRDIVQDMADSYAYGQYDFGGNRGGWRYDWNTGPDNSVCQWAAIGLIPAEREWGLTVPDWVKQENRVWLGYSQHPDGWFGYDGNSYFPWGPYATTPSGMVQMAMDGIGRSDPRWDKAESRLRDNFGNTGGPTVAIKDYYYGLFSFTKSMLLHDPNGDKVAEPIALLQSQTPNMAPLDWYGAEVSKGDPTDGVARKLVNDQNPDGWWWYHDYSGDQWPFDTAFAIIMLNRTLFAQGAPVAVAQAIPNPGVVGQTITLDGASSFHQDATKTIVQWEWDIGNDGSIDKTGPSVTHSFSALGSYPVRLRVTDNGTPPATAETIITVLINLPPVGPTADAGGPYVFCPGQKWFLDGTRSVNPDQGQSEPGRPGDTLQSYAWDLDGNNDFADASGAQPDVTAYFGARGVGDYLIRLRVTDTTATSFPSSGQPNLSATDSAQVSVKDAAAAACRCVADLSARAKSGKVQLEWKDTGAHHYNVYRSTLQGGPYTLLVATDSRYSLYLDGTVSNGVTYYYVVREAQVNNSERCQSNEARITPSDRTVRNRAPALNSTPVTGATEGTAYSYDVQASDPDLNDSLTYSLDLKPAGMTINPTTGLIDWTPGNAQVGVQNVIVRVTDKAGASVTQTFQITVANVNNPPTIVSTPVTSATETQPYSYPVQAFDPDAGDSLSYFLDAAPAGMTINPATGLIQWTPTAAQIGVLTVTVRAQDKAGATATQSFQVTVAELNRPPQITSTPVAQATEGQSYSYAVTASDPNKGDILRFSLDAAPTGMNIDPVTGLIQWTPAKSQVGFNDVTVRVTDAGNLSSTQTFQIAVLNQNDPPQIVSSPVTTATQDQPYRYAVKAVDPDQGDTLTFTLLTAPAGMAIDAATGLIQWKPTNAQVGANPVTVRVRDKAGLQDIQNFTVMAANVNDLPVITSTPVTQAGVGLVYRYGVTAQDPDKGDILHYALATAPAGMSIDPGTGLIQWTPTDSQAGAQSVVVQVTDGRSTATQSYTLTVVAASQLVTVPNVVGQAQGAAQSALAGANLTTGQVDKTYSETAPQGTVISQDPAAGAHWPPQGPVNLVVSLGPPLQTVPNVVGLSQAAAVTAIQSAALGVGPLTQANSNTVQQGNVISQEPAAGALLPKNALVSLVISKGPDTEPPAAAITAPASGSTLTGSVDIIGTAKDANLKRWVLDYAVADSDQWVELASDTVTVDNGVLARLNTSLLRSDFYRLRLTVYDDVAQTSAFIEVAVNEQVHLGQFELVFEDLRVPAMGLPIILRRVYDTQRPQTGDFGRGWRLALTTLDLREDANKNVFITLPDDRRTAFAFTPIPFGFPFGFLAAPHYTPAPGVYDTLTAADCGAVTNQGGQWFCFPGNLYDPDTYILTTREGRIYTISQTEGVKRIEDRNGNFIAIDANGITTNSGRGVPFTRDEQGRITAITDPKGNSLHYTYDAEGRLVEFVDQNNNSTRFTYQGDTHLLTELNTPGSCKPLRNEYGPDGRLAAREDAAGNRTTYAYDDASRQEMVTNARGFTATYTYNELGKPVQVIDPLGTTTRYTYDANGNETSVTDPSGKTATYTYDASGNRLTETHQPESGTLLTSTYTYNAYGQVTRFTNPLGARVVYAYDDRGNLLRRERQDSSGTPLAVDIYTYDAAGNRKTWVDPEGKETTYSYDVAGNLIKEVDPSGVMSSYEYDANGNRTAFIDGLGNRSEFSFDGLNNLTQLRHGGQVRYTAVYNEQNKLLSLKDAKDAETRFAYDCLGNLATVTDALGRVTRYDYDPVSNLAGVVDAKNQATTYQNDRANRLTGRTGPDGGTWGFGYNPDGYLNALTDPNGSSIQQSHDGMDRTIQRVEPERTINYVYDGANQLRQVVEGGRGTYTFTYDARGLVLSLLDPQGRQITYTRDRRGNLSSMTTPDGTVTTYGYDPAGRIQQIATGSDSVTFSYDAAGQCTQSAYSNGASAEYGYNTLGQLTSVVIKDSTGAVVASYAYTLDGNGQRTAVTLHDGSIAYELDPVYQLAKENVTSASLGAFSRNYSYDAVGSRLDPGATYGTDNRLLSDLSGVYQYDSNGDVTARGLESFQYDSNHRLTAYRNGTTTAAYSYDYIGRRVTRTVDGVVIHYLYSGQNIVAEYDGSGNPLARYTHGLQPDEPLMVRRGGQTYFYHTDGLGSVVAITDAAGRVVQRYGYDAWGNIVYHVGDFAFSGSGLVNTLTYTAREYDEESGLYHYRARAYDPRLGRFLQKDSLQGNMKLPLSQNLYAYVRNNPVNFTDPSGMFALIEYSLILSAPTHNQMAAALIGFMHGFGTTNLVFIGEFLGIVSGAENVDDIGMLWDEALKRTERRMDDIKNALGILDKAPDIPNPIVAGIPGAFKSGVSYKIGFEVKLFTGDGVTVELEVGGGGFERGVDQGLNYLRALRPR